MRIDKQRIKAFLKSLPLPLLIGVPLLLLLLVVFWSVQQNNVNSLARQITDLKQQIDALPATVVPKDKLALEKDRLTLEKDRVNAQNAIYGTLVQAFSGAFFVVTAYLTWRNVKATEEKQVTERFSKAIELLGSEKREIRLGGIYALERIAKDSPKDHWTIMEVLTSFIQEKSPHRTVTSEEVSPDEQTNSSSQKQERQRITTEVQAALTVIRRRGSSKEQELQRIELPYTNLIGANLIKAILVKADLRGAILRGADLRGAILIRANLGEADLVKADLRGANLRGAILTGAITDMETKLPTYLQAPTSLQPEPPEP